MCKGAYKPNTRKRNNKTAQQDHTRILSRSTKPNRKAMSKKLIQKLQQLFDKLPKGKERKAIRERLLKLKLNKNKV